MLNNSLVEYSFYNKVHEYKFLLNLKKKKKKNRMMSY